ncbi:MAG: alpha/beta hydrolase [Dehalococcoidia bacterium]
MTEPSHSPDRAPGRALDRALPRRSDAEQPREFRREITGVTLVAFEWSGEGAPIVLVHGTGFHARVWDQVARRLPGRRVIAVDLRGHGRSSKPEPPYTWSRLGEDVAGLIEGLDLHEVIGVGHSMGGHTMADAATHCPERIASLVLIDPTILDSPTRADRPDRPNQFDFVLRRRNEWASPEEMIDRYAGRFPFSTWRAEVLRDYAVHGLLPSDAGEGYVLACPPPVEAAVYAGRVRPGSELVSELQKLTIPVRVLRARTAAPGEQPPPFAVSGTMPDLAAKMTDGTDFHLTHLGHFIPMEEPEVVARHIIEAADAVG